MRKRSQLLYSKNLVCLTLTYCSAVDMRQPILIGKFEKDKMASGDEYSKRALKKYGDGVLE